MNDLIFLDTETTGISGEDRLLQVAYKYRDEITNELFKPPVPIDLVAMATHHITGKMVADKPSFQGSDTYNQLKALSATSILVAHNAKFDLGMLEKEGLDFPRHICTYRLVKYLDYGQYDNHRLQYLRYFYGMEIEATAHDALGDILVLEQLFIILADQLTQKTGLYGLPLIDRMVEISKEPVIFTKFDFGKYDIKKTGMKIVDVVNTRDGRQYMEWLLGEKKKKPEEETDWIYTLNYYLNK